MKTKIIKVVLKNRQRGRVALLFFVCLLSLAVTQGSAQLLNQKHITAVQMGDAAEGSRVTIVADSALGDYEAFRRGDRFYVKIPLAEFKSTLPRCCASGFEDVQVQRVGDSVIVSFRLQPGATARVDQRSNRLDVIFSAPNRAFRNNVSAASSGVSAGTSGSRGPDAAGPLPPGSASPFGQSFGTGREGRTPNLSSGFQSARPNQTGRVANPPANQNNQAVAGSQSNGNATSSPSPVGSPAPVFTPSSATNYPTMASGTPAASLGSQPAIGSSGSSGGLSWKTRGKAALQWMSANRLATLLGLLILLSLILYLVTALRRRQTRLIAAKSLNASKVQPKQVSGTELDELPQARPEISSSVPADSATKAASAANSQNQSWVLKRPSVASPSAGHEHSSDKEEREVFEL